MTPNHCRRQVQNLLDALLNTSIIVYRNTPIIRQNPRGLARITWPQSTAAEDGEYFLADFFTVDSYIQWLEGMQYSALLYDGSLLQVTFDLDREEIIGHRLAYIPCPYFLGKEGEEMLLSEPFLDVIYMYRDRGNEHLRLRTPIRFDFDPNRANDYHPAAHFTLNDNECRIPACGPLTLHQFVDFILRSFYPSLVRDDYSVFLDQPDYLPRSIVDIHEQCIHINWRT